MKCIYEHSYAYPATRIIHFISRRGVLMIYSHRTRVAPEIIDFSNETTIEIENIPFTRLLTGLAYAHLKHGKLPWRDLVKPAANLAR